MRIVLSIILAALVSGCAGNVRSVDPQYHGYYNYGSYGLQTKPCRPFNADELTSWAKALGTERYHSRGADVTVRNGIVDCSARESAGSRTLRGK